MGWARWAVTFERLPCSLMKSRKRTRSATQRRSPRERALLENQRTARVRSTKHVAMERVARRRGRLWMYATQRAELTSVTPRRRQF